MTSTNPTIYSKTNPFFASIKERFTLSKEGSKKKTFHLVLDLAGSGIHYRVGDSLGIIPEHDPELVQKTLDAMKCDGEEIVQEKLSGENWKLRDFLTKKGNITEISKKLLSEVCQRQTNSEKKAFLDYLQQEEQKDELKKYISSREIWDLLLEHSEVIFSPQELCNLFMPLLPRFYSIASSMKHVGEEVHLTVAPLEFYANGHLRHGVCTHYLCHLVPLNKPVVPVYIQPSHGFFLPEDCDAAIIMIGPGTGVAPFRAFMQERLALQSSGNSWLFFGEWNRSHDFFYEEFWNSLAENGKFYLDAAFSRDQEHKIYVQHLMLDQGTKLYQWLESGAYLYVCGDAQHMAKDVDAALLRIIQEQGGKSEQEAKLYVKQLRAQKRYLRDVY